VRLCAHGHLSKHGLLLALDGAFDIRTLSLAIAAVGIGLDLGSLLRWRLLAAVGLRLLLVVLIGELLALLRLLGTVVGGGGLALLFLS